MNYKKLFVMLVPLAIIAACSNSDYSSPATGTNSNASADTANTRSIKTNTTVAGVQGKELFEQKCGTCHGSDGTAGIGNAANLATSKTESSLLLQIIADGKNSMPSFKGQLSEADIHLLVSYVKTLRK